MEHFELDLTRLGEIMDDPRSTTLWSWRWMEDDSLRSRYESRMRKRLTNETFMVDAGLWMNEVIGRLLRLRAALSLEVAGTIVVISRTSRGEMTELGSRIVGHDPSRLLYSLHVNSSWFVYKEEVLQSSTAWNMSQGCWYRLARDGQDAIRIVRAVQSGEMDEKGFFESTDSLFPYLGRISSVE